jgi:hypothetical protein
MDEVCDMNVRDRKCIKILVGKSEGKKHLVRSIRTSKDNIRMNLQIWCEIVDFIHLVQDRKKWRGLEEHGTEISDLMKCGKFPE